MRSAFRIGIALVAALFAAGVPARAISPIETTTEALQTFQSSADNYNLIALGGGATFTNYGDTQGALAVEGNLSLTGGSIADQTGAGSGNPSLYVTGSLTLSGTTELNSGYASLPGLSSSQWTWSSTNHTLTGSSGVLNTTNAGSGTYSSTSPLTNPAPSGWNWSTEASNFSTVASTLASTAANGTIGVSGQNLTFTPDTTPAAGSTVVFTLDASEISGNEYNGQTISNVSISVPSDVNYVINVINASGTTLFGSGVNVNSGSNDSQLLWNIEGSGTVTLGGGNFSGSVLAPSATIVNGGNTTVNGEVVADAFTDTSAELHFVGFQAMAVIVPEPMTFALWGVGLCALAIVARRRWIG